MASPLCRVGYNVLKRAFLPLARPLSTTACRRDNELGHWSMQFSYFYPQITYDAVVIANIPCRKILFVIQSPNTTTGTFNHRIIHW